MYSKEALDQMTPSRLWCELGLHRGVLEEGRVYYLGNTEYFGTFSRGGYRCVLNKGQINGSKAWHAKIASFTPKRPFERPIPNPTARVDAQEVLVRLATPAMEYLNQRGNPPVTWPKIRKPTISFEDRPDIGMIATPETERSGPCKPRFKPTIKKP